MMGRIIDGESLTAFAAGTMLRRSLGRPHDAALLERAAGAALAFGARTAGICEPRSSPVSCGEMGAAVIAALERLQYRRHPR